MRIALLAVSLLGGCALKSEGIAADIAFSTADSTVRADSAARSDETSAETSADVGELVDSTGADVAEDSALTDTRLADTLVADTLAPDLGPPCSEPTGKMFGGHCYFMLMARPQPAARTDCSAAGGHLVTVTSTGEHDFLKTMGVGDRWIGLRSPSPSNDRATYVWITGEAKTITPWYMNDPDNMGPCVAMHGSLQQWVDRGCAEANPAICERD